ncbi:NnrU family protein [Massilia sp. YIM B02443]|uniref:NnrU family protein n=1 Tax=Massilia sp. YIM B02443 TaxID=3050127 RepID=UPI0025B713B9|nr:NnrU family protein [Massilia sp. YIM B02443]
MHPITNYVILSGAIVVLALVGAVLQDRKKSGGDAAGWPAWQSRTSNLPFVAIMQRRARFGNFGTHALAGGVAVWLLASWVHGPLAGWPAGIWRWLA